MVVIPRITDRYRLSVGEVSFEIAPLTKEQKREVVNCSRIQNGESVMDLFGAQCAYIKYGVKAVDGVQYPDGEKFTLSFDGDGLDDRSINELLNLPCRKDLVNSLWQMLESMPDELVDPVTGEKWDGVRLELIRDRDKKT